MIGKSSLSIVSQFQENPFEGILGKSPAITKAIQTAAKLAATDYPVLILGETGTGKELMAQAIHKASPRAQNAFVVVNCAAIPSTLFESELFGHTRGSFTGAVENVVGKAELADGGTLFLDEIAEIPPDVQPKLLRFLEDFIVERIGGRSGRRVNIRVISATNCKPEEAIRSGKLREDLFYRLGIDILLSPLRERDEDLQILAEHFLERTCQKLGAINSFDDDVIGAILAYPWPGNVRELIMRITKAVVAAEGKISSADLGLSFNFLYSAKPPPLTITKSDIMRALRISGGNKTNAAHMLGISRMTLWRRTNTLKIQGETFAHH